MKVIGICGSPRGQSSRTKRLVEAVIRGAGGQGAETEFVDLCALTVRPCTGCETCYATGFCIHGDDAAALLEGMATADGIVLGSPVYIDHVTAQMKAFIDRTADAIHCQRMHGRYGCSVATTWGSGGNEVVEYLNHVLHWLGVVTVGGMWVALGENPEALLPAEREAETLGETLAEAIRTRRKYPGQEEEIGENWQAFREIVRENRASWPHEYAYWKERGWL
ncbi:MAG: flavodoxin family protein [Methanomicrobiales archaeon]|nr:flavodoxin family protein [Methanomicrobiales archaeon]